MRTRDPGARSKPGACLPTPPPPTDDCAYSRWPVRKLDEAERGAYAREQGSPAWAALEEAIGVLEGGTATAFSSGVGAAAAVIETLPTGAKVVGPAAGYAWTRSLLHEQAEKGRIVLSEVDTTDTEATLAAAKDASLLWLESPSNPLIEITELDRILPTLWNEQVKVAVDYRSGASLALRADTVANWSISRSWRPSEWQLIPWNPEPPSTHRP